MKRGKMPKMVDEIVAVKNGETKTAKREEGKKDDRQVRWFQAKPPRQVICPFWKRQLELENE